MMNQRGWRPPQQASALKSDSWAVKANNRKFSLDALDYQMKHLNVTEKATIKEESEQLSNLSASGKENKCLFLMELKIEDRSLYWTVPQSSLSDPLCPEGFYPGCEQGVGQRIYAHWMGTGIPELSKELPL